jgi:hypothetical protein
MKAFSNILILLALALLVVGAYLLANGDWHRLATWGGRALPVLLVMVGLGLLVKSRHVE